MFREKIFNINKKSEAGCKPHDVAMMLKLFQLKTFVI